MTLYDYISALTDKQKISLECFSRFGEQQYVGKVDDLPYRLCTKLILEHGFYVTSKDCTIVVKIKLA